MVYNTYDSKAWRNNHEKMFSLLLAVTMVVSMAACSSKSEKTTSEAIEPIYRTTEEWQSRYSVTKFGVNEKLNSIPEGRPSVKCVNGTFVGNTVDGIDVFKGIPYAQAPVGELRFQKAKSVLPSDDIYDATYFGESCLQPISEAEAASLYQQGEDCLKLNIWSNPNSTVEKKPVLVYIHGGGFIYGGTSDPLYEGWNFAYYNPDVIVVTITYRMGVMGFDDVSSFEGGDVEEYKTSGNNAFYDQIEALRWIQENISQFGGDSDNVTICGESAGGCAVSILCTMDEAKGLFSKAVLMSGAVNLCVTPDHTVALPQAVKETFGVNSISDFQAVPYDKLSEWWSKGYSTIYNFPVMDGKSLETDMFKAWEDGASKDITILQGHTQDEFREPLKIRYSTRKIL